MTKDNIVFIGLDTHKEFTEVAYELDEYASDTIHFGRIPSTKQAFTKLACQFQSKYPHARLHFTYEACPCGYWVYRLLTSLGHCCYVIAQSQYNKRVR